MTESTARRILMLAPLPPWPVNNGAKVRMFHLARLLSERHQVTLVALAPENALASRGLAGALPRADVRLVAHPASARRVATAARFLLGTAPFHVAAAWQRPAMETIATLGGRPFDVVHVFHLTMMQYADAARGLFRVYDPMGNETLYMERLASLRRGWAGRLLRLNVGRVRRYEAWASSRCDAIVSVSAIEAAYFQSLAPQNVPVVTIPIAPDTTELLHVSPPATDTPIVLFMGSLDWFPSVDAARFLAEDIWPRVRAAVGDAQLWLAGKDPVPEIERLGGSDGVTVIRNPGSMLPLLRDAAVVAVPIRTGSGTKIKTVEAMAAGRAIVATSLGCEGWAVEDTVHLRIGDRPEVFAAAVIDLLQNPSERQRLAANARQLVCERYTAERMVHDFERLYDSGLRRAGAA